MAIKLRHRHKNAEEYLQTIARIVISAMTLIITLILYRLNNIEVYLPLFITFVLLLSVAWSQIVKKYPTQFLWRRYLIAIFDLSMISYALYLGEQYGPVFFSIYIWVIVGNGMRFGARLLLFSMMVATITFLLTINLSSYWQQNISIALGILLGIIVLPLFFLVLIRRLHILNQKLESELQKTTYAANHDDLTDLVNRNYFFQRLKDQMLESKRYQLEFSVMFIDLDGFKKINDTYGHDIGDKTLNIIAERLDSLTRNSDVVARLGGDEFGLLLHKMYNIEDVNAFSKKLNQHLSKPFNIDNLNLSLTASIGISQFPNKSDNPDDIIKQADKAMYQSKHNGKNCFTLFGKLA